MPASQRFWRSASRRQRSRSPKFWRIICTEGGLVRRAVDYWFAAGERALHASANIEAIEHLLQGLQSLKSLPDTPERQQTELRFQTALGPAYIGYGSHPACKAFWG
jgi:predicted ATPase